MLASPVPAASAVILAILGARRRARLPDGSGPTVGQQVATFGTAASSRAAGLVSGVGRIGSELGAGAVEVGGVAAAMTIRTASTIADKLSSKAVELAGGAAAKASGLVVDGVASVSDLLQAPFRGAR